MHTALLGKGRMDEKKGYAIIHHLLRDNTQKSDVGSTKTHFQVYVNPFLTVYLCYNNVYYKGES